MTGTAPLWVLAAPGDPQTDAVVQQLKSKGLWESSKELGDEFFYNALPLCAIDAVFSMNARAASVAKVISHFCEQQGWKRFKERDSAIPIGSPTVADLVSILGDLPEEQIAEVVFDNRQRTSPAGGILKAEAVRRFAVALQNAGLRDFPDLSDSKKTKLAEQGVRQIPGQGSGKSFSYFLMLAGSDDFAKPDRMIERFVAEALGYPIVDPWEAAAIVHDTAARVRVNGERLPPRRLDYIIWDFQRTMRHQQSDRSL